MITILCKIIRVALWAYELAMLVYVLILWLKPAENRWTSLLRRVIEPVLTPMRTALVKKLPPKWQVIDWSPVAAWLLCELASWMFSRLAGIFA